MKPGSKTVSVILEPEQLAVIDELRVGDLHGFWTERRSRMLRQMIKTYIPMIDYINYLHGNLQIPGGNSVEIVNTARHYYEHKQEKEAEQETKIISFPTG